jgi:hypothetical protein
LLAVVRHHHADFDAAAAAYESALAEYQREGRAGLAALSLADFGQLLLQQRKPSIAQEKFNRARTLIAQQSTTPRDVLRLFELDSLCGEADAHRGYGNWAPACQCLQQALPLAEALPEDHPLRAVFHERCGWYSLDVWRVDRAREEFRTALAIREANDRASNHRAIHFVSWNRQGQAMVDFYLDEAAQSAAVLKSLLPEGMSAASHDYTERQLRELRRRQPNLLERLADAELIDPPTRAQADEHLSRAIHVAEEVEDFRDDGRWSILVRLKFKSAVVALLAGDLAAARMRYAEAEAEAAEFHKQSAAASSRAGRTAKPPSFDATQKLAGACIDWRASEANVKSAALQRLVDQFQRDPANVSRDELQLLLLVGEWLLGQGELAADKPNERKLAQGLHRQCAVRPRGEAVGEEQPGGWRLPKLLERYRELAASRLG